MFPSFPVRSAKNPVIGASANHLGATSHYDSCTAYASVLHFISSPLVSTMRISVDSSKSAKYLSECQRIKSSCRRDVTTCT